MKKTQLKDTLRNIRSNFVSWLAIVVVTMIGCGTYCGSIFYMDELVTIAADLYQTTNYEDLMITSAQGLTENEIEELRTVDGISDAEGTYRVRDAFIYSDDEKLSSELFAVNSRVSMPDLVDGQLPLEGNECAVTADTMKKLGIKTGDSIKVSLPGMKNAFNYKVTGTVNHGEQFHTEDTYYVFVPKDSLEFSAMPDRYNYILLDADLDDPILSKEYFSKLSDIRTETGDKLFDLLGIPTDEEPGFLISDRNAKESFLALNMIVSALNGLAIIFIVLFLIVGIVVVFSTVTVIINNQKKLLGFMKAYGFENNEILLRNLVFSESAVLFGLICAAGLGYGIQFIVRYALEIMFVKIPDPFIFEIRPFLILCLIELILGVAATIFAVRKNISQFSAVELMNWSGYAPGVQKSSQKHAGGSLYSRLILRNMTGDLARVITSVVVIAGCTLMNSLSLTLNRALLTSPDKAREDVTRYDLEISLPDNGNIEEAEEALDEYEDITRVSITKKQTYYRFGDHEEAVTLIVADNHVFNDFMILNSPDGKDTMKPNSKGILVQNKISERIGLKEGDKIDIFDDQMTARQVRVRNIFLNYQGRLMIMTGRTYEEIFGTPAEENTVLVRLNGTNIDEVISDLNKRFPDASVSRTDHLPGSIERPFTALVLVMIVLSLVMSIFVLLNLVNIFVHRRQKELIVMAINGFSYHQQIRYLLMEAMLTVFLGVLLGVAVSAGLTRTGVMIVESTDMMNIRAINWKAQAIGALIEALFALLIYLFAFRHVKKLKLTDI